MFTKFYDALYDGLVKALVVILGNEHDPVKRLSLALQEIRQALQTLRAKVLSRPFPSRAIEITFFKEVKPKFYALRIFHIELYNLDMNKPAGTRETLLHFYRQELQIISRFFKQHSFLYQYFKAGFIEMDELYFLRYTEIPTVLQPEQPDPDPEFSTGLDYLFARFLAFEQLQQEILGRMGGLDGALVAVDPKKPAPVPALKWTGKKVNLIELIYGLQYSGQLNNGNTEIVQIVALMEQAFDIKLGDAHHAFGEIRERKVESPSRFLESMAGAIQQRVDEDLSYNPELKKVLEKQKSKR